MTKEVYFPDPILKQQIANALVAAGVPGLSFAKLIKFKSGIMSPFYMDCRKIPGHPQSWKQVMEAFATVVLGAGFGGAQRFDAVCGIQTGAIPFSSAYAFSEGEIITHQGPLPHYSVKKKDPKDHGLSNLIDGGDPAGKRVVIFEDMVTTNESLMRGIEAMRDAGAIVVGCIAIMSYDFRGANQKILDTGIPFAVLTSLPHILNAMQESGQATNAQLLEVFAWYKDYEHWHKTYVAT